MSRRLKWFSIYYKHKLCWARWVSKYYDFCYGFPHGLIERRIMYIWQTKIHLGEQNGSNFNWRIWYNNKYHNNSSNNKSPLPRGLQPLPRFLSHTEQLLWYFLWIDLSNIRFRFDVVEEKEGPWGQTVLEVLAEFFEAGLVTASRVRSPWIKLYYFWLGSRVLLTESNISD